MNGLQAKITDDETAGPDRFALECPECGELSRHRFVLLARRAFEEHADEAHPAVESPLDQIRTLVDLAESEPGTWECELGPDTYLVRQRGEGRYEVEVVGRRAVIDAELVTLDDVRIVIGGRARLVSPALATAATIQLRHGTPAVAVPLE
ncbi:hypothetical protein [Actinacidiphila sp. ITFR-21]|uniref:hypothetical protein n=1 Tax=Actinacidiphila sp. ITFR-21 TaxID=3075199 RepID=UPI00288B9F14|nr:hypothetical protein [Streptomyces sp. ITFR-21]WNI20015.1 hypothetical protein RLT57_31225 [Streptomyces sp. ITFR-21]